MIFSAEPSAFGDFQTKTALMEKPTMGGVTHIPKRCKCDRMRTEKSGRHTKAGFVCGMCSK